MTEEAVAALREVSLMTLGAPLRPMQPPMAGDKSMLPEEEEEEERVQRVRMAGLMLLRAGPTGRLCFGNIAASRCTRQRSGMCGSLSRWVDAQRRFARIWLHPSGTACM